MDDLSFLDPVFDLDVMDYLNQNPRLPEYDCLKQFFADLRQGPVKNKRRKVGRFHLVAACKHILKVSTRFGGTVKDIKKVGGKWVVG